MPWYAQNPGGWPFWADSGTEHERVLVHLGYVETRAPGTEHEDGPAELAAAPVAEDKVPVDEQVPEPPVRSSPPRK